MSDEQKAALSGFLVVLGLLQVVIWLSFFSGACQ